MRSRQHRIVSQGLLVLVVTCAGAAFGFADAHVPAPHDAAKFWVGNLSSPWILLPFAAGWLMCTPGAASFAGLATSVAGIAAFYGTHTLRYAPIFAVGWMVLGSATGLAYGGLGGWWRRRRPRLVIFLVTLPFVIEPALWAVRLGHLPQPFPMWVLEVTAGALLFMGLSRLLPRASDSP